MLTLVLQIYQPYCSNYIKMTYRLDILLLISATSVSISREEELEDGGRIIKVDTRPVGTL